MIFMLGSNQLEIHNRIVLLGKSELSAEVSRVLAYFLQQSSLQYSRNPDLLNIIEFVGPQYPHFQSWRDILNDNCYKQCRKSFKNLQ